MSKIAFFILSFGLTFVVLSEPVHAANRPLSKIELLEGIGNWRQILRAMPTKDLLENDLQQDFLFRLQFAVERRYDDTDAGLVRLLVFMKEIEDQPSNSSALSLSPFLDILIRSVKEIKEPQDALWPYIQQFMVDNSLRNPVSFEETIKQRDYFNQFETVPASALNAEEINLYFIATESPKSPAKSPVLQTSEGPQIGELEQRPGPELPTKTGTTNSSEGESNVRFIEVINR